MATESTAQVTLVKGPLTLKIGAFTFKRDSAIPVPINSRTEALIAKLRNDPKFHVTMPSKKAKPVDKESGKKKRVSEPPPPVDDDNEEEEGEEEEEGDEDDDEEDEDQDEAGAEQYARKELKDLKKAELLKIAKTFKLKLDPSSSRNTIVDAIMEAQSSG
jgi:hypothetical protein